MNSNSRSKYMLDETETYIRTEFENEGSGHDWWHIHRVRNLACHISKSEGGDLFLVEMSALLHDLDDWKISDDNDLQKARKWLNTLHIEPDQAEKILQIISEVSYKGAGVSTPTSSVEAAIVQDADRLDAIGAIGIARTFAYGGNKGRLLYDPGIPPEMHSDFDAYQKTSAPTINHFYEKLLLLKSRMNTPTAIRIAEDRHEFMENYLQRFFSEWDGKI